MDNNFKLKIMCLVCIAQFALLLLVMYFTTSKKRSIFSTPDIAITFDHQSSRPPALHVTTSSPYIDGKRENGWWNGGIIYRPINRTVNGGKFRTNKLATHEPYLPFNKSSFFLNVKSAADFGKNSRSSKPKVMLWYVPPRYTPVMSNLEPLRFCPQYPCVQTTNRSYASESAMMAFNGQIMQLAPPVRTSPDQVFLFQNTEPQSYVDIRRFTDVAWRGLFNWTLSYRVDSDIFEPYGVFLKNPKPQVKDYKKALRQKKKKVAMMSSHCPTKGKREAYVKELQKYIEVDIYGGCGTFRCGRASDEECNNKIARDYKFYLAFENCLCPDYVTEKFFRFMPYDIVVVSRASNNSHQFAPKDTFVDANDFRSPKQLAERLHYLDEHDEEYMEVLRKKDEYICVFEDYPIHRRDGSVFFMQYQYDAVPLCEVCRRLWNLDVYRKIIPDIGVWFKSHVCETP